MTSVWDDLHTAGLRANAVLAECGHKVCQRRMRERLSKLAAERLCPAPAPWWIDVDIANDGGFLLRLRGDGLVRLENLANLKDGAELRFAVEVDPRDVVRSRFKVGIEGVSRATEQPWFARLESDGERDGPGRCSHPMQHLHIGTDPNARFQVRAPVYPLMPWDALDWLLATADPRFEPCPHV